MRVIRKFKQLTNQTYPHGTEEGLLKYLPTGYKQDSVGNYYLQIGEEPSTMFACHLDTACSYQKKVNHVFDGKYVKTDGTTILGADDKAGMVVILYMIEKKIPGLYYFFLGEEVGCIGSGKLAKIWNKTEFSKYIKKVVSFDRRGTDSIITEQMFGRSCSDEFAKDLSKKLNLTGLGFNFSPDPTGIYTDSAKFMSLVPECTNISVGYYSEHTNNEKQDVDFLKRLCKGVCLIDWEDLIVKRDHTKYEDYYGFFDDEEDEEDDFFFTIDDDSEWSRDNYSYFQTKEGVKKMYISKKRVDEEKTLIYKWLFQTGYYNNFKGIIWNGNSLFVESGTIEYVGERIDLVDHIPELGELPISVIKETI
jgi:hypothetical protein